MAISDALLIHPALKGQRVLHVAAECAPLVSTGGLGEVIGALPPAQAQLGAKVGVLLPCYGFLSTEHRKGPLVAMTEAGGQPYAVRHIATLSSSVPVYAIEMPQFFGREGDPYRDARGVEHADMALRFAVFCEAAARLMTCAPLFAADAVHLHDWHAAATAAWLMHLSWRGITVFSIHNLAFQGELPLGTFATLGLPAQYSSLATQRAGRAESMMNLGLACSNAVATVSPRYAQEIQTPALGCGLERKLRMLSLAGKLYGVLNGIDTEHWNPEQDPVISRPYGESDVDAGKTSNRHALADELGLTADDAPVVAYIGRLTPQKGADLLATACAAAANRPHPYRLVIVGVGDLEIANHLRAMSDPLAGRVAFCPVYDPALVHRVLAGSDVLLMPSRQEPCGLVQMCAQRYGTLPVAPEVGGLSDSIVNADASTLDRRTATGVLYSGSDAASMMKALQGALALTRSPATLSAMRQAAMRRNFSWDRSAARYMRLYQQLLAQPKVLTLRRSRRQQPGTMPIHSQVADMPHTEENVR
ncbi:MAG: glycogen/starch synthase [Polycyclovorans sp.]|nr:glycogen/starch synthase [Polycyclovorans sp.]